MSEDLEEGKQQTCLESRTQSDLGAGGETWFKLLAATEEKCSDFQHMSRLSCVAVEACSKLLSKNNKESSGNINWAAHTGDKGVGLGGRGKVGRRQGHFKRW